MFEGLKTQWRQLREAPPGERFQRQHERRADRGRSPLRRLLGLALGGVVTVAGLILMPAPGPGAPVVLMGLTLLAYESRSVAHGLDALELRLRPPALRLIGWWKMRRAG